MRLKAKEDDIYKLMDHKEIGIWLQQVAVEL